MLIINSDTVEKVVIVGTDIGPEANLILANTSPVYSTTNYNGYTLFRICGTQQFPVTQGTFEFVDSNYINNPFPSGTIQYVDWGDGTDEIFSGANLPHIITLQENSP